MPDLLPGSDTRTWLEHLQDEYDFQRAEAERYRVETLDPGTEHALETSRMHNAEAKALFVLKLICTPFKGVEGLLESDPVPTINRWLRSRGLAGLTVYCPYCHQAHPGPCRCYGPSNGVNPTCPPTVADKFPGCFGERDSNALPAPEGHP